MFNWLPWHETWIRVMDVKCKRTKNNWSTSGSIIERCHFQQKSTWPFTAHAVIQRNFCKLCKFQIDNNTYCDCVSNNGTHLGVCSSNYYRRRPITRQGSVYLHHSKVAPLADIYAYLMLFLVLNYFLRTKNKEILDELTIAEKCRRSQPWITDALIEEDLPTDWTKINFSRRAIEHPGDDRGVRNVLFSLFSKQNPFVSICKCVI